MAEDEAPAPARERVLEPVLAPRGIRGRIARIGTKAQPGNPVLEPLFNAVRANHPKADLALLERAYLVAEKFHTGQTRKSGEPYITHPLAVTTILAELGMTEPTLVAALLHDTVEDTPYTLGQLRKEFGDEVAELATLVVVDRPGTPTPVDDGFAWVRVDIPELEISSTELRLRVAEGRSIRYLTPEGVATCIDQRGLYRWAR